MNFDICTKLTSNHQGNCSRATWCS